MRYNVREDSKVAGTITGISGKNYLVERIEFDDDTYHFFSGDALSGQDITDDIYRADKLLLVPDFNVTTENYRISSERGAYKPGGTQPLDDSTASNFVTQITTDPLAAPLETLNNTFDKLVAAPGARKLVLVAFLGLAVFFALKQATK